MLHIDYIKGFLYNNKKKILIGGVGIISFLGGIGFLVKKDILKLPCKCKSLN